jgi:hypothetical protein
MLKAVLNRAFHSGRVASDQAWRRVKPFAKVDEAVLVVSDRAGPGGAAISLIYQSLAPTHGTIGSGAHGISRAISS